MEVDKINDLRSALEILKKYEKQFHETNVEINPDADLAGVYKQIGAGGTVERPTRLGPAMMFNNVKGYKHCRVLVGLLASRERVALLLGAPVRELGKYMGAAVKKTIPPITIKTKTPPCQEIIYKAGDDNFDIRNILPAPTNTPLDAGPSFDVRKEEYGSIPSAEQ